MGDDACAAAGERGWGALEHLDVPARAQQQVCGEQPAERAADDEGAPGDDGVAPGHPAAG